MMCLDCYCRFELTAGQREMLGHRLKFGIVCPQCRSENVMVATNQVMN